ncbi:hypothetical protein [Tranquillimonas alkanivorans]|uniref:DUF1127 domain-containing protein n=1 Tax=Tranquillimonas alkanivorans TaxID=441119 RepID=A0A1I5R6I3_9RHOB|nr:hypothetical protein [Tranquillimonas alkanivorans]SFP54142.1 hypothetical protein SAMN04488047_10819 [Tranquillimonas alkanivorans]
MATATTNTTFRETPSLRQRLDEFFAGIGAGFNAYIERQARFDQIQALEAKSDAELAELGLKREDIPRHVFRDLLWA